MSRIAFAAALLACSSATAFAQPAPSGKCALNLEFDRINTVQLPSGQRNTFLGGNIVARCPSQKMILKSDSLEVYGDEGRSFFIGHVDYKEPRLSLKSDFLTYFQKEERMLAFLNVDAKMPTGSTLKGQSLEFFRAVPRVRPKQRGVAVGRPTMSIIERDAQGKPQPPVTVTGNSIWLEGDSVVASSGEVVVVRPELTATGDSLYLDGGSGLLRIMRKPKITGTKGRPFTLVGETIDLLTRRRKLERVVARKDAEAVSEDLNLKSDTIDLRVADDLLQRAIAWGAGRARATSPTQIVLADSIDVVMPAQRIREMHAVRKASAEGMPDTSKFSTTEKDRLIGDTIVATFDTVPARDTARKPAIKQLVAIANASSLQHLPPRDTSIRKPAINYVTGQRITVSFDSAKVKTVKVDGRSGGAYLEPDSTLAPPRPPAGSTAPTPTNPTGRPIPTTPTAPPPTTPPAAVVPGRRP
jgi:lipopolysaccharide export system protein LptA